METISNQLADSAFFSGPEIPVLPSSSPPILLEPVTSPDIKLVVHKPGRSPNPRRVDALTVVAIPRDSKIGNWRLKSVVLVEVRRARKESVATTWLEGVVEYGTGQTDGEAIMDLVVSLGEYRESLENRENRLGDSALNELSYLRNLIESTRMQSGLPRTP